MVIVAGHEGSVSLYDLFNGVELDKMFITNKKINSMHLACPIIDKYSPFLTISSEN